jgi:hypothetical protein
MLLAESLRPVPFCPQNPIHAPVKSIGQRNQHSLDWEQVSLAQSSRNALAIAKRGGKHTIPPANPSVSLPLKTKHFLASFGKKPILTPFEINVESRRHCFAPALSLLQTLKLVCPRRDKVPCPSELRSGGLCRLHPRAAS